MNLICFWVSVGSCWVKRNFMPPFIQPLDFPFLFNVAEKAQSFSIMKTEDIKGHLIFTVWILWFQRNLFTNENDPEWIHFPQTLYSSFEFTANILFKQWFGGALRLGMFILTAKRAEDFLIRIAKDAMMSAPSGRWLSKVVIWDVKKNKNHGWGYFPLHMLLNKGNK